jgi:putative YhbY family RNA-binding protein
MTALTLNTSERREQRALAHHLHPLVLIGNDGLTDAVVKEADSALASHGLIKIRVFSDSRPEREALLTTLADRLGAAPVQHIGKLLVLWRPLAEKAAVVADDRMGGPRVVKIVKFSKSNTHRPTIKKVTVFGNERVTSGGSIKRSKLRMVSQKKKELG